MNIVIPIAGGSELFPRAEFHFPKPLIEVTDTPMIESVLKGLAPLMGRRIFIVNDEECEQFSLDRTIKMSCAEDPIIVGLRYPTAGAVCSVMMAVDHIDNDEPLLIVNGDQIIDADLLAIIAGFESRRLDAGVITFSSTHPRWSYIRSDEPETVNEAAEKRVISRDAIAGFYYFRKGRDFVAASKQMIMLQDTHEGSFYIAPSLNQLIIAGKKVGFHRIPASCYHSFYSPKKLQEYNRRFSRQKREESVGNLPVTVLIPMAGAGSRFVDAGYKEPKPFIDVKGMTMVERVMDNLRVADGHNVLIAQSEHLQAYPDMVDMLEQKWKASFVPITGLTQGAACTALCAHRKIDWRAPLLLANCDQIVDFDANAFVADCRQRQLDGSILVFRDEARDPKWSFARVSDNGLVTQVREKQPISDLATVGIYLFMSAGDFFAAAMDMIVKEDRTNNEFYVCPVYNHAIAAGCHIGVYEVPASAMHGLGAPQDLKRHIDFLSQ